MTRSVLEGVAFGIKDSFSLIQTSGLGQVEQVRISGGGAKSELWRQIMADVYNKRILKPRLLQEATSLGAAIAGGVGVGLFENYRAAEAMVQIVDTQDPNPSAHACYERLHGVFQSAYTALVPVFEELAQLHA